MRFGIATREITPPFPTRMHGYAARQDMFDGSHDPLTFTAVVVEEGGRRALIGAADICTFPNAGSLPGFMDRLAGVVGCPKDNIVLNASHTHGGPMIPGRSLSYRVGGGVSERYRRERYARTCMESLEREGRVPDHVAFQVQTLWLNRDLALIGLNVEPLCGLGARVEAAVAPKQAMLLGYTNGCVAYTPDTMEMKRGGYETTSYLYNGWSGPLMPGIEDLFAGAVMSPGRS